MKQTLRSVASVLVAVIVLPNATAEEPATSIAWMRDLPAAFAASKEQNKVLMICINAKNPLGERNETAAKGLREIVYKDPAVIAKSQAFVCVLLTAQGSSGDYGELEARLGIEGLIVSPQHIFVRPGHEDGEKPLFREQYWRYGSGPEAVKALIAMMDKGLTAYRVHVGVPDPPADAAKRPAWIQEVLSIVRDGDADLRTQALERLIEQDADQDCLTALVAVIEPLEAAGKVDALAAVVRTLGVPGFEAPLPALHELLKHKDDAVRGNTAVTLEYIGSPTSVEPLLARAKRERNEHVGNHIWRAIGRCGAGDAKVRKKLLRRALPGKDRDFAHFGAVIGLAYFEGDASTARSLEKQFLKLGSPMQTGTNTHSFLRSCIAWALSEIGDPKSAAFFRKKVIKPISDDKSPWKDTVVAYYESVAKACEGNGDAKAAVHAGMNRALWTDNARELMDACRTGRPTEPFAPKGEWGRRDE